VDFTGQAITFVTTLVTGALLGVIFDFYRVLRGIFKPRAVITYLFDCLYWLFATILAFATLLASNWGELRLYVFMGLAGGAAIYYRLLSRYAVIFLVRVIRLIVWLARWIHTLVVKLVLRPLGYCFGIFMLPFAFAGRKLGGAKRRAAAWWRSKWPPPPPNQDVPPE